MIVGELVHAIPGQIIVYESGPEQNLGGLPGGLETYTGGWFDTWRTYVEEIVSPQTGANISTGDESVYGVGTHRRAGVYVLDITASHSNAAALPFTITIDEIPTPNFVPAAGINATPRYSFIVQSGQNRIFSRSFRIRDRMVRFSWAYPGAGASVWYVSAILRSAS